MRWIKFERKEVQLEQGVQRALRDELGVVGEKHKEESVRIELTAKRWNRPFPKLVQLCTEVEVPGRPEESEHQ